MVGVTGIEPVTPSMSTKCSPAELYAHPYLADWISLCGEKASTALKEGLQPPFTILSLKAIQAVKNHKYQQLKTAYTALSCALRPPAFY